IITGGKDPAVIDRFGALGISDIMMVSGPKLPHLNEWMARNDLKSEEVAYVGDDVPDVMCMKTAGLSVAPRDASIDALAAARYVTDAAGGYGVARELLEQVLRAKNQWPTDADSFGK
ncbi:MAG: HAD hydrolase family protein, partial [Muribaculaceae bacterium]|nr:HAD hydrolase family protein [Muribaculaceae bacterium]